MGGIEAGHIILSNQTRASVGRHARNVPPPSGVIEWTEPSSRCATIVVEGGPAQPLSTVNPINTIDRRCAVDEFVAQPLVISFTVVMRDELHDRPSEMTFAERDQPIEALIFDRPS